MCEMENSREEQGNEASKTREEMCGEKQKIMRGGAENEESKGDQGEGL